MTPTEFPTGAVLHFDFERADGIGAGGSVDIASSLEGRWFGWTNLWRLKVTPSDSASGTKRSTAGSLTLSDFMTPFVKPVAKPELE